MVDPNPARGMPLPFQRYWLAGKGALKVRWNTPGDFLRCVRLLSKYFPKNPKGLCNILHTKATGGPPGHGSLEHSLIFDDTLLAAAKVLMDKQPVGDMWAAPLAPIGRHTGEPQRIRQFEPGALTTRPLPMPLAWQKVRAPGHDGSVMVGRVLGFTVGPDHMNQEYAWGWGDWFDADIVPEVKEARYLAAQGVLGPSVTPGGRVVATRNPETGVDHITEYTIGDATLVTIPAFSDMRMYNLIEGEWPDDDPDMDPMGYDMDSESGSDCGCGDAYQLELGEAVTFAVNTSGWRGLPLAPRDAVFDNDDAVKRITAWANVSAQGADVNKLRQAFLWRDPRQPETNPASYRLPVGDIISGRLTLIYHAIYAAAALISGAHGGLPGIPDEDKNQLRNVITDVYRAMASDFNDPSIRAPWDRPENAGEKFAMADNPNEPYGDVKYADPGYQEDGKKRYPIDTEKHIRAAWSYINQQANANFYTPEQLKKVKDRIVAAAKKVGISISDEAAMEFSTDDYAYPLAPSAAWFEDPDLDQKTPLQVLSDGRVFGHLAAWGECHRDVTNRECILAPRSQKGYAPFHLGEVMSDDGSMIKVGKIVMDTRHADVRLNYAAAAIHYDNTGDEVAVVRAGEDEFGIWVAGAVVPEATPRKVAKLRRSPLSGDWRAVEGHLELTAALAVNVPAFPVYAMDGDDQLALVAAGSIGAEIGTNDEDDSIDVVTLFAAIRKAIEEEMTAELEQEDLAWELRELLDDDQGELAAELAAITEEQMGAEDQQLFSDEAVMVRQADAQFTVSEEPEGANQPEEGELAPIQGEGQVPVPQPTA